MQFRDISQKIKWSMALDILKKYFRWPIWEMNKAKMNIVNETKHKNTMYASRRRYNPQH